jgi:hypothetical protein
MIIATESELERREEVIAAVRKGTLSKEEGIRRLMELNSDELRVRCNYVALLQKTGDSQTARETAWATLKLHPASAHPYFQLADLLAEDSTSDPLYASLMELGFRKALRDAELLESLKGYGENMPPALEDEATRSLPLEDRFRIFLVILERRNRSAPAEVATIIRPFRLLDELEETENLAPDEVDAFLKEGEAMTPLLVGMLRGWMHGYLRDECISGVRNAIALLGEMGGPQELPDVLEFCSEENAELAQAADWATNRIFERMPEDAVRCIEELAPEIDAYRSALWATALAPQLKVSLTTLRKLTGKWRRLRKEECSRHFPLLFELLAAYRGAEGEEFARELFQSHAKQLSSRARIFCQTLFEVLKEAPPPPAPEQQALTVYDLCAGKVKWAEPETGLHSDSDEEASFAPPEVPARKRDIGRNDPCWCGSGKKYKKCHRDADERAAKDSSASEFQILRHKLSNFMQETISQGEKDAARREFGCESNSEEELLQLIDWMIHDWKPRSLGRTLIEAFLQKRGGALSTREREIAESWARSFIALYEVQEVQTGKGVVVKNVHTGEQVFVHDVSLSKQCVRWDLILTRVVEGERGLECTGCGLRVSRQAFEPLRKWMEEDRRAQGLPWPDYMKQNIVRVRRRYQEIADEWLETLQLQNSDGDTLLFSKAVYEVLDEAAALEGLRRAKELAEDSAAEAKVFTWLRAQSGDGGNTVLGTVSIKGRELTLECNSKRRLDRGMDLLASYAGTSIRHLRNEFLSTQELKRQLKEKKEPGPPERPEPGIPPEVERELIMKAKERHYAQWLDRRIPALGGRTPREAALTLEGKRKLTALLRDLENIEEHARLEGKAAYDIRRLRRELNLEE